MYTMASILGKLYYNKNRKSSNLISQKMFSLRATLLGGFRQLTIHLQTDSTSFPLTQFTFVPK